MRQKPLNCASPQDQRCDEYGDHRRKYQDRYLVEANKKVGSDGQVKGEPCIDSWEKLLKPASGAAIKKNAKQRASNTS